MRSLRERAGPAGEAAAIQHLRSAGFRVIEADWRCRLGQIDVICEDGDVLVIVEVKARRGIGFGLPQEAVDHRKRLRLRMLCDAYMAAHGHRGRRCRIDVVAVLLGPDLRASRIEHIRDAVSG